MTASTLGRGSVGGNFLKLGAGEAAARVVAFAATVYLARTLGPSTYGVIALATAVLLYLSVLSDAGMDALGVRDVADNPAGLPALLPEVLGARFLIAVGLIGVTITAGLAVLPEPDGTVLAIYSLTLLSVALGSRWVHLGLEQPGRAALARVLSETVSAGIIVMAVRGPDDLARVPLAQFLGESLGALLLLRLLPAAIRGARPRLRPGLVSDLLRRSWPMVLHALLGLAIFNSDLVFLRVLRDSTAVGFYAAAYTLVSFFLNLGATYTLSLIPTLTRLRADPAAARGAYDTSMAQVVAAVIPVVAGGLLVSDQVVELVFGSGYGPSAAPLRILLVLLPFALVRSVAQGALLAHGHQRALLQTVGWAAAINAGLNLALIPRWGMTGAAWATAFTEAARAGLVLRFAHRLGLPLTHPRRFRQAAVAGAFMTGVVALAGRPPLLVTIAAGAVTYLGALTALGGLRFRRNALPELTV